MSLDRPQVAQARNISIGEHRHSKYKDLYEKKKHIVSVTYENERISIKKNSLPYIKCVLRLSCVVHGPICGRLMACTVNGFTRFTVQPIKRPQKSAHGPRRRDVTHILCKVSCFLLQSFHFRRLRKR